MASNGSGAARAPKGDATAAELLPFDQSLGYQIRITHLLTQKLLQLNIEPHGVTLGMWYYLRALWDEDGLTQRELSARVGTMEPTTLSALATLERAGFVKRVRNRTDKRKINVRLTPEGRSLKQTMLPIARGVVEVAKTSMSPREVEMFLALLLQVQGNIREEIEALETAPSKAASSP